MLTKHSCGLINRSWVRWWSDGSRWCGSCRVIECHTILISETHTYTDKGGEKLEMRSLHSSIVRDIIASKKYAKYFKAYCNKIE